MVDPDLQSTIARTVLAAVAYLGAAATVSFLVGARAALAWQRDATLPRKWTQAQQRTLPPP